MTASRSPTASAAAWTLAGSVVLLACSLSAASAQGTAHRAGEPFSTTGTTPAPSDPLAGTTPAPVSPLSQTAPSNTGPGDGQLDTRAGTETSGASASVGSSAGGDGAIGLGGIGTGANGVPAMTRR